MSETRGDNMEKDTDKICCMCYKEIDEQVFEDGSSWVGGHNAHPLVPNDRSDDSLVYHDRCCSSCNSLVISARIAQHMNFKGANELVASFQNAKTQTDVILAHMNAMLMVKGATE